MFLSHLSQLRPGTSGSFSFQIVLFKTFTCLVKNPASKVFALLGQVIPSPLAIHLGPDMAQVIYFMIVGMLYMNKYGSE